MTICDMSSVFPNFQALYLRAYWLECPSFFENLYSKIADDHVRKFWRPKNFSSKSY